MGAKITAVINFFFGLLMLGLAVGIPLATGRRDIGFLVGMGGLALGGLVCLGIGLLFIKGGGKLLGNDPLLRTGVPGTAVIQGVRDTGITLQNGMLAILEFNLAVTPPAGSPYQVVTKCSTPRIALAQVAPGRKVGVKIDPQNPSHVTIDWSAVPA